jgi:hypothetical protein
VTPDNSTPLTPVSMELVVNWIIVMAINWMKGSEQPFFAWISRNTPMVSRVTSIVFATIASAGFTLTYDQVSGALTIGGLSVHGVVVFITLTMQNIAAQHVIHKITRDKQPADTKEVGK